MRKALVAMVRQVDSLGRVSIPIDYRRAMGIVDNGQVEIIPREDGLLIRPYRPSCTCGAIDELVEIGWERRCRACLKKLLECDSQEPTLR